MKKRREYLADGPDSASPISSSPASRRSWRSLVAALFCVLLAWGFSLRFVLPPGAGWAGAPAWLRRPAARGAASVGRAASAASARTVAGPPRPLEAADVGVFLAWLDASQRSLGAQVGEPSCHREGYAPELCEGSLAAAGSTAHVTWLRDRPAAMRVELAAPMRASAAPRCEDFGAFTVRRWSDTHTGIAAHCRVADGPLRGWHLSVEALATAGEARVTAFTDAFWTAPGPFAQETRNAMMLGGASPQRR